MTRRRWIADSWDQSRAVLSGTQASHLARVLRAQVGMEFDIVAGDRVRRGVVAAVSDESVTITLGEDLEADAALPVTLLLAVFKFDRMEWAIEKSTELGVERIVPVIARRTEKHLAQAAAARVERWRRIAREASQQSRRSGAIAIEDPRLLKDALPDAPHELRLLLAERERNTTLREAVEHLTIDSPAGRNQRVRLAVGPEGGWTSDEGALFADAGWKPVGLGPRILRAETAAIAAIAVIAALLD